MSIDLWNCREQCMRKALFYAEMHEREERLLGELSSRFGSLFMTNPFSALVMNKWVCEQCLVKLGGRLSSLPVVDGVLQAAALLVDLLEARQLLALLLQLLQPRLQLLHLLSQMKLI